MNGTKVVAVGLVGLLAVLGYIFYELNVRQPKTLDSPIEKCQACPTVPPVAPLPCVPPPVNPGVQAQPWNDTLTPHLRKFGFAIMVSTCLVVFGPSPPAGLR